MAVDFLKLVSAFRNDGDWEGLMFAWNSDADNQRNGTLMSEDNARKWVKLRPDNRAFEEFTSKRSGGGYSGLRSNYKGMGDVFTDLFESTLSKRQGEQGEFFNITDITSVLRNVGRPMELIKSIGSSIGHEAAMYLRQTTELLEDINVKTGMAGRLSADFRREIELAQPFALSLGVSWSELSDMISDTVVQSGKFKLLNTETINQMTLASKFIEDVGQMGQYVRSFELIGLGAGDTAKYVQQAAKTSLEQGLNARTVTKSINENLKALNAYGFKEGVEGLTKMAQKSIEFRMNMSDAFKFAEKVWDPDKALDLVANLQVLGGAFGDLNDPLKLMYMATNNVEGLQDAIVEATKSLVTFNNEQGRFEITGVNLRRAKAMAAEMGIEMEDLTKTAIASMERVSASTALMSRGFDIDKEDKDFLINLSRMEGGKMVISIPENLQDKFQGTQVALEDMTATQAKMILDQKAAFKELSVEDYARQQVSALENIVRDISFIRAAVRVGLGQTVGEALENFVGGINTVVPQETKKIRNMGYEWMEKIGLVSGMMNVSQKEQLAVINDMKAERVAAQRKNITPENILPEKSKPIKEEPTTTTTKIESTITIRSADSIVEPIKKELWNDPAFSNDIKNTYLKSLQTEK